MALLIVARGKLIVSSTNERAARVTHATIRRPSHTRHLMEHAHRGRNPTRVASGRTAAQRGRPPRRRSLTDIDRPSHA